MIEIKKMSLILFMEPVYPKREIFFPLDHCG
jgi:hypothetical protein